MLEVLSARIKDLTTELEQSAARHNSLIGAIQEVKALYAAAVEVAPAVEEVVEVVEAVV